MLPKKRVKTWSTPVNSESSEVVPCALCSSRDFKQALNCEGFGYVRCTTCSLYQINPQPSKNEVERRYSEKYGQDYLSYELENEARFLELQLLGLKDAGFESAEREILKNEKAPRILDIGCATGALLEVLRSRGWHVTGVEISPCADYGRNKRNLDIRSLPLEENHFPSGYFDVVYASHLIEHLNNPGSFLDESARILKENGWLFITTPNIAGFQARLMGSRWRSAIFDHLYLFSVKTFKSILNKSGFTV
ncbi:MAG: class I SAM-dependent methyltransferase, partial [Treponema sp.]|nr:class I SAM-dependent methyltransferase [Treponema sp.]